MPGPHRKGRERVAVATWNTRAAGWAQAEAVIQDLEDEMRHSQERGVDIVLLQEASPLWEKEAEPPASPAWCWLCNPKAPSDTAVAMRRKWETQIRDIESHDKWLARLIEVQNGEFMAIATLHMPTSWDTEERWISTLAALGAALRRWRADRRVAETAIGGDFNIDLDKDDPL